MEMTFVLKQRQPFMLVFVLAMASALYAHIEGALTFDNKLPYGFILYHPPGCCFIYGFQPPPPGYSCYRCPDVYLPPNKTKTMDPIVGPYPLQFLQLMSHAKTYCMIGWNLTATDTVTIGPEECSRGQGIETHLRAPETDFVLTLCMGLCIG